jgi:hypothetical protein
VRVGVVCVSLCVCMCMHVCVSVCVCVCMCVRACTCLQVFVEFCKMCGVLYKNIPWRPMHLKDLQKNKSALSFKGYRRRQRLQKRIVNIFWSEDHICTNPCMTEYLESGDGERALQRRHTHTAGCTVPS